MNPLPEQKKSRELKYVLFNFTDILGSACESSKNVSKKKNSTNVFPPQKW